MARCFRCFRSDAVHCQPNPRLFYIILASVIGLCLISMWIGSKLSNCSAITRMAATSSAGSQSCAVSSQAFTPYSVAFVTIGKQEEAAQLAEKLVGQKLAACVNISPKVMSIYEWKGKIEKDEESLMMIKTKTSLVPKLIDFVRANHPYEVCEVISIPIQQGNPAYLNWLGDCLAKEEGG